MKEIKKKGSTKAIILALKKKYKKTKEKIWKDIAERLEAPRRNYAKVNLSKISKLCEKFPDKIFLIPGKLLGNGNLNKKVHVVSFAFSENAKEKIEKAKGKYETLEEFIKKKVDTSKIMIVR